MKQTLSILLFLLSASNMFSQIAFQKVYGGAGSDVGNCVRQTSDNGYIIVGSTVSFGETYSDILLIKTNTTGDTLWTRIYGGTGSEYGRSVEQTNDEGFIICAGDSYFQTGFRLIKTNQMGDTTWTKTMGGSGFSAKQTTDGGYIATGSKIYGTGGSDLYLVKTNSVGDTTWTRTYGGSSSDFGYNVQETSDGGYISIGTTLSFGAGSYDVFVVKTDVNGNLMWSKTYGGIGDDRGQAIRQTSDGGYILAGTAYSFSFKQFSPDMYVLKIDEAGNVMWSKTYGGDNCYDYGQDIIQTRDGK